MSKKTKSSAIGTVRIKKPRPKKTTVYFLKQETCDLLDSMFQERELWEQTTFKQANEKKYEMLGKCLAVFNNSYVKAKDVDRMALRQHLKRKLQEMNVKVQDNTSVLTMIVRFVFNSDRNRANTYVKVLKAAAKISPEALPAWIAERGGVEEIKRESVVKPEAVLKQQKIKAELNSVKAEVAQNEVTPLATVQIAGLKGAHVLLLAKPTVDATVQIVGALSEVPDNLVENVLTRIAKARVNDGAQVVQIPQADQELLNLFADMVPSNSPQVKEAA